MNKLKIALQKSGRLSEGSINIMEDCGINVCLDLNQLKISTFDFDVFFLRDDDIPNYVQEGVVDVGIVGKNILFEQEKTFLIREHLGFSDCRLSFAVPKESLYKSPKDLSGKCIATSHPKILNRYLKEHNIKSSVHIINGSVEIAPKLGVADAICDLVSSGSTLDSNELKEIESIFFSEAVLICHPKSDLLVEELISHIKAVNRAKDNNYLFFYAPNKKLENIIYYLRKLSKILRILPIADSSWTYVQIKVPTCFTWNAIEELKKNSANDFAVFPIRNDIVPIYKNSFQN